MARNILRIDVSGIEETISKLDKIAKQDTKKATEEALTKAGERIEKDTIQGLDDSNLPAGGDYHSSQRWTEKSVIRNPQVEWKGESASIGVGFDFGKKGAGGYLISGTPKMKRDEALYRIYKSKSYMKEIQDDMEKTVGKYIKEALSR